MWNDPIVEEIRSIRDSYAKQFNYNLEAIFQDIKEQQSKSNYNYITLPSKFLKQEKSTKDTKKF